MDELRVFCVRMLGDGEAARAAEQTARQGGHGDRVRTLAAAAAVARAQAERAGASTGDGSTASAERPAAASALSSAGEPSSLAAAVAAELAAATAQLPQRQREALALRELLALPHQEIGRIVGVEPVAVASLLARARLRLRSELRGESPPAPPCDERERALRTIALRQDAEAVSAADHDWLIEHLGHCRGCAGAHSAMLEASACYRAWRSEDHTARSEPPPGATSER